MVGLEGMGSRRRGGSTGAHGAGRGLAQLAEGRRQLQATAGRELVEPGKPFLATASPERRRNRNSVTPSPGLAPGWRAATVLTCPGLFACAGGFPCAGGSSVRRLSPAAPVRLGAGVPLPGPVPLSGRVPLPGPVPLDGRLSLTAPVVLAGAVPGGEPEPGFAPNGLAWPPVARGLETHPWGVFDPANVAAASSPPPWGIIIGHH